jgi:uncharacterized ferredoxin-like protein
MNGIRMVAELMAISARTAPKSKGEDFVKISVIEGNEVAKLADSMIEYGESNKRRGFDRDGDNVKKSSAVVLIGLKDATTCGLNCGACGFNTCKEVQPKEQAEFKGPQCAHRLLDMGIAVGSAVKTAGLLNVDNRIMYRIGAVARKTGLCDCDYVMGIPLSATGKNIFFDRKA